MKEYRQYRLTNEYNEERDLREDNLFDEYSLSSSFAMPLGREREIVQIPTSKPLSLLLRGVSISEE